MNGWQRLWVLASVVLYLIILWTQMREDGNWLNITPIEGMGVALVYWVPIVTVVYLFGMAIAWVRRGFNGGEA